MLDLFETPWDRLSPAVLAAWLEEAGEEGITWEAKADDEKGRLHINSVRKAACGLANQIGGYILIGAKWDKNTRTWSLPGVTSPDPEPDTWIGKAMRSLQPVPRYVPQSWVRDDGRLVAVVWVEPVDVAPCMTSQGRIYERVSGETLPVQDPALLDRLQRRGDAARARAEQFADRAAQRALDFIEWADGRAVGIAHALAPIGRETDDIGARLFVPSFREAIVAATSSFWGNKQPSLRRRGLALLGPGYHPPANAGTPPTVHNPRVGSGRAGQDLASDAENRLMTATVFTIGYETRDAPGLVSDLAAAGVEVLVDVRELPLSRRRGFSKTALRAVVEAAGIAYQHERAVGNPKPFRDAWKAGDSSTGIAGYIAHLNNGSRTSVDALAERVAAGGVCLMCVEEDPSDCHRSLLVDALRERLDGLRVEHL